MPKTTTISAIRTILRAVDGYRRDSSAPSVSKDSDGTIYIFFHKLDQVTLASRCEEALRARGLSVINHYPELMLEP